MKTFAPLAALALVTCALACNKQPEPIPRESADKPVASSSAAVAPSDPHAGVPGMGAMPPGHPPTGGAAPAGHAAGPAAGGEELAWTAPATWTSAPNPNPMRKATFKIPKAGGEPEDAELAVSSASGGVEPNVKRWEQQFGDAKAKTEARTVNGLKVTMVEIKGKFASGGMMGAPAAPKDNQMLLGAIVDSGDQQHFFKMVGGEKTVTAAKKDFDKFVSSLRTGK